MRQLILGGLAGVVVACGAGCGGTSSTPPKASGGDKMGGDKMGGDKMGDKMGGEKDKMGGEKDKMGDKMGDKK